MIVLISAIIAICTLVYITGRVMRVRSILAIATTLLVVLVVIVVSVTVSIGDHPPSTTQYFPSASR